MIEIKLYIGLNDMLTKKQLFSTDKYMSVLKKICFSYHVAFSIDVIQGGYFHENGDFSEENTLVLTLIDIDRSIAEEIAKDLCVFFHQDSIMITEDRVRVSFIHESL